jgi:hypothetical protein
MTITRFGIVAALILAGAGLRVTVGADPQPAARHPAVTLAERADPDAAADAPDNAPADPANPPEPDRAVVLDDGVSFDLDTMTEAVTLGPDTAAPLQQKFQAMQTELTAWEQAHAPQLAQFADALGQLADSKDADALRQLVADHQSLLEARTRLAAGHRQAILALLSTRQRLQWESAKVHLLLGARLVGLELDDVQQEQIKAIAQRRGRDLYQLKMPHDPKAVRTIVDTAWQTVHDTVLTAPQRQQADHSTPTPAPGVVPAATPAPAARR